MFCFTHHDYFTTAKEAFIVTLVLLTFTTFLFASIDCCLRGCLERNRRRMQEQQQQHHAAVLQMATRRKLSNRVIPEQPRRTRGRSRALEFDMTTSSDEEVVLKPEGADTMPKMRTRSSTANYHSE